jgi:Fic family protein
MLTVRLQEIIGIILQNAPVGISEILGNLNETISIPTLNRDLVALKNKDLIVTNGSGPSLKYIIKFENLITFPINAEEFLQKDIDERKIIEKFNISIFDQITKTELFSKEEATFLTTLTKQYQDKLKNISTSQYKREFERLMIELSWKSAQIEGNTYDLLDTEQLLKFNINASKHTLEETQMLLNHKSAIEYTNQNSDLYAEINLGKIIDIHTLLTQKMGISKNPRKRIVRITGTKYLPPENEFIILEALEKLCLLINKKTDVFEKALLSILLLSYIQPFEDGNKRTARLTGNALLMQQNACPLSYRSVNAADYKRAILLFYELNNISAFKEIFMNQYKFAVENYF